jgi:hypothetical protein
LSRQTLGLDNPRRVMWLLIAVGSAIRLVLGVTTYGEGADMYSWQVLDQAVREDLLGVYSEVNPIDEFPRYPYPPAFWPGIVASSSLEELTGIAFESLIHLPIIAADAGIALLVWTFLGMRGAGINTRLAGVALVALGPAFGIVSGWHGQFDSVAILPAVAALVVWERPGTARRALVAGALIGLGAAVKAVAGLVLIALLPSARSRSEAVTLAAAAVAVPLVMLAPLAVADPPNSLDGGMGSIVTFEGVAGSAGLSLVAQPALAANFVEGRDVEETALSEALSEYGSLLTLAALLAVGWLMLRRRTPPPQAATVLWLTVYVAGYAVSGRYFVYGLPFFIMAGHLREVAVLQVALTLAAPLLYIGPYDSPIYTGAYVAIMLAVWLALLVALVRLTHRIAKRPLASIPAPA